MMVEQKVAELMRDREPLTDFMLSLVYPDPCAYVEFDE